MKNVIFLAMTAFSISSLAAYDLWADVILIGNTNQEVIVGEKEIRELYLGKLKMRQLELIDQAEGQQTRSEFIDKFLKKSESELKLQRSILVFSGSRIPSVLADDKAVLERVSANQKSIGYVSGEFAKKFLADQKNVKIIFTVK